MGSVWGNKLKVSIFGESHGEGIGVVIDNLPPGIKINMDYINKQLSRRAPGKSPLSTSRREGDSVKILSGVFKGYTTGAPLCGIIYNEDQNPRTTASLRTTCVPVTAIILHG